MAVLDPMRAVVRTDVGHRSGIGVGAFVLALVTAGAMAHVGVRMKGIEVAYDLGREKRVNTQLEEERRRLNIEIGMLKDPGRVVAIARDKLKMGPPAPSDIVRLAPGQILAAPTPVVEAPRRTARAAAPRTGAPRRAKTSDEAPAPEAESQESEAASEAAPEAAPETKPETKPAPGAEGDE
jgi:cell division protein FtsL